MTPELQRFVKQEVARQLNVILSGSSGDNTKIENETINSLYPGSPQISARPVMHPYGIASRAPVGTIQVTAKQGADAHNRIVLGHRDDLRQGLGIKEGETMIYASDGKTVLATVLVSQTDGVKMVTDFGFWQWAKNSDMVFDTGTVKGKIGNGGKVVFQNAAGELVNAIIQAFATATAAGFPVVTDLTVLTSFKGSI